MKFYDADKDYDEIGIAQGMYYHQSCAVRDSRPWVEIIEVVNDPTKVRATCGGCANYFRPVTAVPNDNTFSPF